MVRFLKNILRLKIRKTTEPSLQQMLSFPPQFARQICVLFYLLMIP